MLNTSGNLEYQWHFCVKSLYFIDSQWVDKHVQNSRICSRWTCWSQIREFWAHLSTYWLSIKYNYLTQNCHWYSRFSLAFNMLSASILHQSRLWKDCSERAKACKLESESYVPRKSVIVTGIHNLPFRHFPFLFPTFVSSFFRFPF